MISCTLIFFFFNDTATTEIYTLSLHDALPIYEERRRQVGAVMLDVMELRLQFAALDGEGLGDLAPDVLDLGAILEARSEEHTSELQSQSNLVCRLLLEKKKKSTEHADMCDYA